MMTFSNRRQPARQQPARAQLSPARSRAAAAPSNPPQLARARRAFSLIEVLLVIGISALVGALVLGGFRSFSEGNRRGTCTSNLVQIYRAARLYGDDFGALPAYDANDGRSGGLWLLWGFDDPSDPSGVRSPERALATRYLRSARPFHCPSDPDSTVVTDAAGALNKRYLSYQLNDNGQQTYQPVRTTNLADPDYPRQLLHFHPDGYLLSLRTPSNTVITWCKWHRSVGSRPDNVLFFDGSIRRMAIQSPGCTPGSPARTGWRRLPDCDATEGTRIP